MPIHLDPIYCALSYLFRALEPDFLIGPRGRGNSKVENCQQTWLSLANFQHCHSDPPGETQGSGKMITDG